MSLRDWERLTNVERAFFINAFESDLLAGVFGDLDPAERDMPLGELAQILLLLVDRGFIGVRRYAGWIDDDGREGLTPDEVIPRHDLPQYSLILRPGSIPTTLDGSDPSPWSRRTPARTSAGCPRKRWPAKATRSGCGDWRAPIPPPNLLC